MNNLKYSRFRSYLPTLPSIPVFDEFPDAEDLSANLQSLWRNQNAVNQLMSSMVADDVKLAETYFEAYSNPVFKKVIQIQPNIAAFAYNEKFHNDGKLATFSASWLTGAYVFFH